MRNPGIDHLVVAAESLDEGTAYILETLGVSPQQGGEHLAMGTHNRVVRLGDDCYLEIIAINPNAPQPPHARWFELDTEAMHERLRHRPRLITWALRTDRIEAIARKSLCALGPVKPMSRGDLHWRLTVTEDGHLPDRGLVPFLIQWDEPLHPALRMEDLGCRLLSLSAHHAQPETLRQSLRALEAGSVLDVEPLDAGAEPFLLATIETPGGRRTLA